MSLFRFILEIEPEDEQHEDALRGDMHRIARELSKQHGGAPVHVEEIADSWTFQAGGWSGTTKGG